MKTLKAFTLVEVLIASAIFAVVMLVIYSAFHIGVFGFRDIQETLEINQTASAILGRITLDLKNCFPFSEADNKFSGSKNSLNFLSLIDNYSGKAIEQKYSFVSYALEGGTLKRLLRKDKDSLNQASQALADEMADNVSDIAFTFGYVESGGSGLSWKENWQEKKCSLA